MIPQLNVLLEIQTLDQEALELKEQMAKYPAIWEEVKQRLNKATEAHKKAVENKERHLRERRRIEQKLRMFADDLRKFQDQSTQFTTNKEVELNNKQIEATKKKISQAEEQGIALMDGEPVADKFVADSSAEVERLKEMARTEKERIRVQFNDKKNRLAKVESERDRLRGNMDSKVLDNYDRVSKRYPGQVLASVRGKSCTGCHWQLLPDMLVKLHEGKEMQYCTNCGRILTEDEDHVPGQQHAS